MRLLVILLAALAAAGQGRTDPASKSDGPFALTAQADSLRQAGKAVVYRGVPRPSEPRPWEVKGEPVELHGAKFGAGSVPASEGTLKELTALFAAKAFRGFPDGKSRCLNFHPDYALEWKAADQVYRALFCFDCNELKVYKFKAGNERAAELEVYCQVDAKGDKNARDQFRRLLAAHFRPTKGK